MNRVMDIISNDAMRPVLYAIVKVFDTTNIESNRAELLTTLKGNINRVLENSIEQANAADFFNSANETDLY